MSKVIMLIMDGLRYDVAVSSMGYLYHLVEKSRLALYKVKSEMPSQSRVLYEVLMTGTPSWKNGITSNHIVRLSNQTSIFHLCRQNGLRTAAAADYWFSELYQKVPFDFFGDREQHDESKPIQHAKFYVEGEYPDSHVLADAEYLRKTYDPHFLLIHSMGMDDTGHKYTYDSKEYRGKARDMSSLLAMLMPKWIEEQYEIIITADHGMHVDGAHGGSSSDERDVPLFCFGPRFVAGFHDEVIPQLEIAPLVCDLLGFKPSDQMDPIRFKDFKSETD